ncbi:MAG: choice-of-anchor J domain-containing protein [Candidatus Symbiothrix sp.]|jgi:hypothetical protein|nr:choice-of-anchor J domain-containing protein [Candidatus Symbiothrix sp.]
MMRIVFSVIFIFAVLAHGTSAQNGTTKNPGESRLVAACDPLPGVQESFEGDFPPACWLNEGWERVKAFTVSSPYNVTPQDGEYMLRYDCELVPDEKVRLTTPAFLTGGENKGLYFWFFRDSYYPGLKEKINIYLSETEDITALSPVATLHRSIEFDPVVDSKGWYEYRVLLPCAAMSSARAVIEAVGNGSEWGGAIFIDNLSIKDVCMPPENFTASLHKETDDAGNRISLSWEAPQGNSSAFSGFNLYRNGTLLAENLNTNRYQDRNLQNGKYTYSIEAIYSNDCGKSERIQAPPLAVSAFCENVWNPGNPEGKIKAKEWYHISLEWENPTEEKLSYVDEPAQGSTGGVRNFIAATRFTPADLSKYHGKRLTEIAFIPRAEAADYVLKVWKGGSDLNPGTEIHSQPLNIPDLNIGSNWNRVRLTTPLPVDSTLEMWIGISYGNSEKQYPAAFDDGPVAKDGYSNLIYLNDRWTSLFQLNPNVTYNWCIAGIVKMFPGDENLTGFNLFRNDSLLNTEGLLAENRFLDLVPGAGTYSYQLSAVYDNFCESGKTAPLSFEMPASPCDNPWNTPLSEGFESLRFPAWCWENTGEDETKLWDQVKESQNPASLPHSGNGMLRYNSSLYLVNCSALLISPHFATPGDNYMLSFWFHRDNEIEWKSVMPDRVNIYLSETDDIRSLEPLLTLHRSRELEPKVTADGWYNYRVPLHTASMDRARIIFEGISAWGANIYIDDINVYDPAFCTPITGIDVQQPKEGEVRLSWEAPVADDITGYRIERDDQVIVNSQTETTFTEKLMAETYKYCITVLYGKSGCTESEPFCMDIDVTRQCDPVTNVLAAHSAPDAVRIEWDPSLATRLKNYSIYRNGAIIGSTYMTTWLDENLAAGPYRYGIVANYIAKDCDASGTVYSNPVRIEYCLPVTRLTENTVNGKIVLNWDFEADTEFTEVLFQEGFENGIPSGWLNLTDDDDFAKWNHQEGNGRTGSHVYSQSYADYEIIQFPVNPNNWLITPAIHLKGTETLEYYISAYAIRPAEHYGVYISTTGTAYNDFTLLFEETLTAGDVEWNLRKIDLSAYKGNVYIAFRHYESYGQYALKLDEVTVRSTWGLPVFHVFRDDALLAAVKGTTYTDAEAQPGITHTYCVRPLYPSCEVEPACIQGRISSSGNIPADKISIHPNPVSGKVYVSGNNLLKIHIYNLTGQLMELVRVNVADSITEVNLSDYKPGVYLFRIETRDEMVTREIIKR